MKKSNPVRTTIFAVSFLLQLSTLCFHSRGAAGDVDLSFDPGSGVNGPVRALAVQPDGKVIIAGQFTTVKGLVRTNLARLNADGSGDSSFNVGTAIDASGYVGAVALQPDGKMVITVAFANYEGYIARLNSDGTVDTSFNPVTDAPVFCVALQPNGKVLIGGGFTTVNGAVRPHVARLYGDSVAPSLNIGRSNSFIILSWPVMGLNHQLQETTNCALPNSWSSVTQSPVTNANRVSIIVPASSPQKFFRLSP
jgi:uncharacterized delta-60 repeat protein